MGLDAASDRRGSPDAGRRRSFLLVVAAAVLVGSSCGGQSRAEGSPTLNWYIFPEPSGSFAKAAAECSESSNGEYRIGLRNLPASADGQRQQMVRRLAAGDSSLDILGLDVTWTAEFAEAGWLAPWPADKRADVERGTLETMIETGTWDGRLYSAPFNTNTQLLWYRKDLVSDPPKTWSEMLDQAKELASQGKPHYVEIQGAQYEGYTVWFNTLVASAGGSVLSPDGSTVELGAPAVKALGIIRDLATSVAADPSLSTQMEDQNRLAFESGTAAFELNYPFVYPSAKDNAPKVFEEMAWAPYPRVDPDEPAHVTIGGIDLAVSAESQHRREAFDAIICLRERQHQIRNAVKGGLPPVLESIYRESSFKKLYPFSGTILDELKQASVRPKTPAYQSVSLQIAYTLSPPSGVRPEEAERALRARIQDAIESKGLVP